MLGNIILQVLESNGVKTVNKVQLNTTPVVRGAITSGELDIYRNTPATGHSSSRMKTMHLEKCQSRVRKKSKSWTQKKISSVWLTPAPANNTRPSRCARYRQKASSPRLTISAAT
ncbi:glycine betaine ABC transporter substrate-binding protein [Enterobacter hormaechei]